MMCQLPFSFADLSKILRNVQRTLQEVGDGFVQSGYCCLKFCRSRSTLTRMSFILYDLLEELPNNGTGCVMGADLASRNFGMRGLVN